MPDGDAFREVEKLESRIFREMDRRFQELSEQLKELKKQIEDLDKKVDGNTEKLENRRYEKHTWTIRQLIIILTGFILGGGALGLIQPIINFLSKGGR